MFCNRVATHSEYLCSRNKKAKVKIWKRQRNTAAAVVEAVKNGSIITNTTIVRNMVIIMNMTTTIMTTVTNITVMAKRNVP